MPPSLLLSALLLLGGSPRPVLSAVLQAPAPAAGPLASLHLAGPVSLEWFGAFEGYLRFASLDDGTLRSILPSYVPQGRLGLSRGSVLRPLELHLRSLGWGPGDLRALSPERFLRELRAASARVRERAEAVSRRAAAAHWSELPELAAELEYAGVELAPYFEPEPREELLRAARRSRQEHETRREAFLGGLEAAAADWDRAMDARGAAAPAPEAAPVPRPGGRDEAEEVSAAVSAARGLALDLGRLSDELSQGRRRSEGEARRGFYARVEFRLEELRRERGYLPPQSAWLAAKAVSVVERVAPQAGWRHGIDQAAGRLTGLTRKRFVVFRRFKDLAGFRRAASRDLGRVELDLATKGTALADAGGALALALGAAAAAAQLRPAALPLSPDWGTLLALPPGPLPLLLWAFVGVGLTLVSVLAGEAFDRRFDPFVSLRWGQIAALLPPAALAEELVFRLGLLALPLALLGWVGVPAWFSLALVSTASAALFARVHGYGPKLPRFIGGLFFGYVFLAYGLLAAAAVHLIMNALLFGLRGLHRLAARRVRV